MTFPALERLAAAINDAKLIPLTGSIRIDSDELAGLIAEARAEAPQAASALARLAQLVEAGRPVPLTSEVLIERRAALKLLEQARGAEANPAGFASSKSRKRLPVLSKLRRRSALAQEDPQQSERG